MPYGPTPETSTSTASAPTAAPWIAQPSRHPRSTPNRALGRLRHASPALLAYAAVRLFGALVFALWARRDHRDVWHLLAESWDCDWYLKIADTGYTHTLGTQIDANNLAFFPLHPLLIRAGSVLVPEPRGAVGLAIAVVCSFLAAWGIFAVGDRLYGRRVGVLLAALWGSLPVALVQWMGYTESLFTALTAWALYSVLTGRWIWAGTLAALAGLTRPTGVALAAAVSLTALLTLWRQGDRSRRGKDRRIAVRTLLGALLAPLGWLSYVAWVGFRLGRWDGYFAVQTLWRNEWDGGVGTLRTVRDLLAVERPQLFLMMVTATLLASAALFVLSVGDRQPLPLLLFTGLLLLIVLGSKGVYFPRARFLLPAFPLLLPLAAALARARVHVAVTVMVAAAVTSAAFGGHMLLGWHGPP
ncbi:glycosyltransferase family 39 protein [Streptomyces sp. NPDC056486]|uniref:glycosyltransferase family 39 protein n=1 Tax=Streptomyces sp. NPDC056486 TaxID=3345835 RepID=UPI0036A64D76